MSDTPDAASEQQPAAFVPPDSAALAAVLPQYDISHLIAQGGMGAVYSAVQRDLERPVAIKVLPPSAGRDRESIERFRSEAKAMARLTHPNIPAVYDFGVVNEFCVLVMELVDGANLFQLIRDGQLPAPRALDLFHQVADAVSYAHSKGIVHGDIKPGNVMVNAEGQAKLADFGLARLMAQDGGDSASWTTMGTPEYAAPELYDKHAVSDHRADIYSLGVVLYEMLTGAPPAGEFELPAEAMGLDPRVDETIARCMEADPANRYQSAAEVRTVVRDVIDGRDVPQPAQAPSRRLFRPTRKPPPGAKRRSSGPAKPAAAAATGALPPKTSHHRDTKPPRRLVGPAAAGESVEPARRTSEATKRNLLIATAVILVGAAVWVAIERGGSDPPVVPPRRTPDPPVVVTPPVVTPGETPTPPAPTPAPPEVVQVPPKPDPIPVPAPDPPKVELTAAVAEINELHDIFRGEWADKISKKAAAEFARVGGLYSKALQKLETDFTAKGDASSILAVRTEEERFNKTLKGVPADQLSKIERLAALQKSLNREVDRVRTSLEPDVEALKEKYLLGLRELEIKYKEKGDDAGLKQITAEFEAATRATDLEAYFSRERER